MKAIQLTIIPAPAALKRDIECFRLSIHDVQGDVAVRVCPNTFPGLVFQQHAHHSAIKDIVTKSGRVVHVPTLFTHGQVTELSIMHFTGPYTTIQVIFKPHAIKTIFDIDASMLTNNSMGPEVFGGETLNQALLTTDDTNKQLGLISDFLITKLSQTGHRDSSIEDALDFIDQNSSNVTVEKVYVHLGISERQLERRFKQNIGISPQLYIRIRRINEAFRLMDSGKFEHLSDIAYELNFHDQSHFIRDIKAFSGINPKNILQKVNDFHHDHVGSSYMYR